MKAREDGKASDFRQCSAKIWIPAAGEARCTLHDGHPGRHITRRSVTHLTIVVSWEKGAKKPEEWRK